MLSGSYPIQILHQNSLYTLATSPRAVAVEFTATFPLPKRVSVLFGATFSVPRAVAVEFTATFPRARSVSTLFTATFPILPIPRAVAVRFSARPRRSQSVSVLFSAIRPVLDPVDITVSSISDTMARVDWTEPEVGDLFARYEIRITGPGITNEEYGTSEILSKSTSSYSPESDYTFSVRPVVTGFDSIFSTITFRTLAVITLELGPIQISVNDVLLTEAHYKME